jgi:ankyrin repeat protein
LLQAIVSATAAEVREWIALGADVNYREDAGEETPLIVAARAGNLEIVRLLVDAGADVNVQIDDDELGGPASALTYAARAGHQDMYNYLAPRSLPEVRTDAQFAAEPPQARGKKRKPTREEASLFDACAKGQLKKVEQLLDAGLDVNLTNVVNASLLYVAAANDRTKVVRLLLDRKAKVDVQQKEDGSTALLVTGSQDVAQMLMDAGANFRLQTRYGQTMLMNAANFGWVELLERLLKAGLDPNARDRMGQTAVHRAAGRGHVEVVRILADAGAELGVPDAFQQTPEALARAMGHDAVAQELERLKGGKSR